MCVPRKQDMQVPFCDRQIELNGQYLTDTLRDCNDLLDDLPALRQRLADDGYLLIRQLYDQDAVLQARRSILEQMASQGSLEQDGDLMAGRVKPDAKHPHLLGNQVVTHCEPVKAVLESPRVYEIFARLFGGDVVTFDYKWLRSTGTNQFTGAHFDMVYMGRGSKRLHTCWTPFGDIDIEQGPLALCVGSHKLEGFERVRNTYGQMDMDRDLINGLFSTDPIEIVDKFGGQWQTTRFKAGDVIVFGMFTMHASLNNTTDRWRLSCDTRFQPADDPIDERWMGDNPIAHYAFATQATKHVSMEDARRRWGI